MKPRTLRTKDGQWIGHGQGRDAHPSLRAVELAGVPRRAKRPISVRSQHLDGDGRPDLFVTNFANEYNTLHLNVVKGLFMDATSFYGLAADTMPFVGWGTAFIDVELDGWESLFIANGHAIRFPHRPGVTRKQRPVLMLNVEASNENFAPPVELDLPEPELVAAAVAA